MSLDTITLFEIPGVVLKRKSNQAILGEVLIDYPKHSQLMVAGALSDSVDAHIEFVDMKSEEPSRLEKYGEVSFGDDSLEKLMVGASFDSVRGNIESSRVIGITANFTYESGIGKRFIRYAKNVHPEVKIVVGGSDGTARPEYYLNAGADVVMLGKAEVTGPFTMSALLHGRSLEEIPGVAYSDSKSGNFRINPRDKRKRVPINQLPLPALDLAKKYQWTQAAEGGLPEGVSDKIGVLETSRGCDEACSFCATTFQIGTYSSMSLDKVRENLDHLQRFGVETMIIIDDNLLYRTKDAYGGSKGRTDLINLFNEMIKRGLAWTFYNGIQFGLLEKEEQVDIELVEAMFQNNNTIRSREEPYVGAFRAYIPLERLTEEGRQQFKKLKSFDIQDRIIREIAQRKPASLNFGFIIGYSNDSEDMLKAMERRGFDIKELVYNESRGSTRSNFLPFCLIPIPGTPDYRKAEREGRFYYLLEDHPEFMNGYASILRGDNLLPHEITGWRTSLSSRLNKA